jgi:hypothetical protein
VPPGNVWRHVNSEVRGERARSQHRRGLVDGLVVRRDRARQRSDHDDIRSETPPITPAWAIASK